MRSCCDLLKIHYLCGDKDNYFDCITRIVCVVICSKFITFAVTKTTPNLTTLSYHGCDLLKIHYLCGDKDNLLRCRSRSTAVVICSKFITFAVTKTTQGSPGIYAYSCDLLKIHYLCGDKDNINLVFG